MRNKKRGKQDERIDNIFSRLSKLESKVKRQQETIIELQCPVLFNLGDTVIAEGEDSKGIILSSRIEGLGCFPPFFKFRVYDVLIKKEKHEFSDKQLKLSK